MTAKPGVIKALCVLDVALMRVTTYTQLVEQELDKVHNARRAAMDAARLLKQEIEKEEK